MSIWNKVLVGLICVASLAFFYMAARTMKMHQYWRDLAAKHERRIEQVQKDNDSLLEGVIAGKEVTKPGIRQVRAELNKLLQDRRRAWFKCDPKVKVNREDGTATVIVAIEQPNPHGIAEGTILCGFEEAEVQQKGRYLGEFTVTTADEKQKQITLVPAAQLNPREIERLSTAKRPWELYEVMPCDNHNVFAAMSDEDKKAILPTASLPEYLKDGKPASKDDPESCVVDNTYVRPLRDYQILFRALRAQSVVQVHRLDATSRDNKLVKDALVEAKDQEEASQKELAATKEAVQEMTRQDETVATYHKAVEQELSSIRTEISRFIQNNKAMAGLIATLQLEASRRIDQRTRAMVQSGTGSL
jgi:hypothetical protein